MSDINDGGQAFPRSYSSLDPMRLGGLAELKSLPGLTKRELFAALIMNGFASDPNTTCGKEDVAKTSVNWADALIAELERK